ncbi:MAG: hypothetical protein LC750_16745 [Actinobacteria bacterium]|nr:hypothetical protein [Actinomycetota bacterium]
MTRFACKRKLIALGKGATYINFPKLARLELNLFVNDEVVIELDTKRKLVIIRAAEQRARPPFRDAGELSMLPADLVITPAPEPTRDEPAPITEKVPA